MQRLLTLVFLLVLAVPAGISISGCTRNPGGNYCNGEGYGLKLANVASIDLEPRTTGISLAFGQTQTVSPPTAENCKGTKISVGTYSYGTTNNQLVDISPTGSLCAGTWNRRSGGSIPDYTICNKPSPLPTTNGLPYVNAYITAAADAVTSNQIEVYVHAQVTAVSLVLETLGTTTPFTGCLSQTQTAQLDSQAYYSNGGTQALLCAPVPPAGESAVPDCSVAIGNLSYSSQNSTIATIDQFGVITAELPGTTYITASVAGSGSSAGYFSTCPPATINLSLNGATSGSVTQGVTQNLVTTITDTKGNTIQGLSLDYQSTNPLDISGNSSGSVTANFAGAASIYAVCQPTSCNPSPIDQIGVNQTGVSITSNPVTITTPGTASSYFWMSSPSTALCPGATTGGVQGLPPSAGSQYFTPVELISGTVGSPTRMPYVPNSMVMDATGTSLYFGTCHELMQYGTASNSLIKEDPNVPGVVLAVAPNNGSLLINDQVRQLFYVYGIAGGSYSTFSGIGTAARWTPDSKTLYIVGSIQNPTDPAGARIPTLFVDNANTGWTTYPLTTSEPVNQTTTDPASNLAITIPGVGAVLSGNPTVSYAWCPDVTKTSAGTVLDAAYPEIPSLTLPATDVLGATPDGTHILGATLGSFNTPTLLDAGVNFYSQSLVNGACPVVAGTTLTTSITTSPLTSVATTALPIPASVVVGAIQQVVLAPDPASNLAFVTYTAASGSTGTATVPYYVPATGTATTPTTGAVTLGDPVGAAAPTAPITGAFSLDDTLFFVSTSGDNLVHYISVPTLKDTQQISPGLTDTSGNPVPATVIVVKPRTTT